MAEKTIHRVESVAPRYQSLADAIERFDDHEVSRLQVYDDPGAYGHTEWIIDTWANGPLIQLTRYEPDGSEADCPVLDTNLCKAVVLAGYVPWGLRPDDNGDGTHLWYLRPIDDVVAMECRGYGLFDDGSFVRNEDGRIVTFDDKADAEAVAGDTVLVRVRENGNRGNLRAKFVARVVGFGGAIGPGSNFVELDPPWDAVGTIRLKPSEAEFERVEDPSEVRF